MKKIIHIDMDAFFAAIEQRDRPELKGKPVIVGGPPGTRSVVCTCSYEARQYGIRSAMPSNTAARLCPEAIFISPDIEKYAAVSHDIQKIFKSFTDWVEPLSLDEAYLDVTEASIPWGSATALAVEIKRQIHSATALTGSAGVSYNKFLAKIASDMDKPDGLTVISPRRAASLIQKLPVGRFFGIGKKTEERLHALGIHTGKELLALPLYQMIDLFGKNGNFYYDMVRGIDHRPVLKDCRRKSWGREITLDKDLTDLNQIHSILEGQLLEIGEYLMRSGEKASHLTIKVKYHDFKSITRSMRLENPATTGQELLPFGYLLLEKTECGKVPVRLLGASIQILIKHDELNDHTEQVELPFEMMESVNNP